jgi:hypothetical protein
MTKKTTLRSANTLTAAPAVAATLSEEKLWSRRAENAIAELARRGGPFTSTDLVESVGPPPSPNLLPALVRAAHRRGLIIRDERAPLGTVWVGATPGRPMERGGTGRRAVDGREPPVSGVLWRAVQYAASRERVSPEEILERALREYLKRKR